MNAHGFHGLGTMYFVGGDVYRGQYEYSLPKGLGVLTAQSLAADSGAEQSSTPRREFRGEFFESYIPRGYGIDRVRGLDWSIFTGWFEESCAGEDAEEDEDIDSGEEVAASDEPLALEAAFSSEEPSFSSPASLEICLPPASRTTALLCQAEDELYRRYFAKRKTTALLCQPFLPKEDDQADPASLADRAASVALATTRRASATLVGRRRRVGILQRRMCLGFTPHELTDFESSAPCALRTYWGEFDAELHPHGMGVVVESHPDTGKKVYQGRLISAKRSAGQMMRHGFGSFVVEGGKVRYTGFWENDAPVVPLHPHEWWAPRDDGEDNPAGYWALGVGLRCSWMCCRRRKKSEISFRDALAAFEADGPPPVCPRRENLRVHRWQKSRAERMWEDARSNDLDFLCRVWEGGSGWGREGRDGEGEMSVRDRLALGLLRRVAGAVGSGN